MKLDGAKVRSAREARRELCGEVAASMRRVGMTGTSPSWVGMIEAGRLSPPEDQCTALAAALGVGLSDLLPDPETAIAMIDAHLAECRALLDSIKAQAALTAGLRVVS